MTQQLRFKVGEIVIALDLPDGNVAIPDRFKSFTTIEQPDVTLHVHYGNVPSIEDDLCIFDSGGTWSLYRHDEQWSVCLRPPVPGQAPYMVAHLDDRFEHGTVFIDPDTPDPFPLSYPFAEVLLINLLARERGVLLHACAIDDQSSGIVFSGTSGAGKSTMASIWQGQPGVSFLTDDRVIVRPHQDHLWMYGTPFHGTAKIASPRSVQLDKLFVLKHAPKNTFTRLSPANTAARLLVRSFPPFWDAAGMAFTLSFLEQIAQQVPCYELGFVPNENVIDLVRAAE